jgi:indole-3-glycerol phosphate synthase
MTILDTIFAHKRTEIARRKREKPLAAVRAEAEQMPQPVDFVAGIERKTKNVTGKKQHATREAQNGTHPLPALIAEIKKASPSRGLLAPDFDPLRLARLYADHGAAAISILTDERFFQGRLSDLQQVHTMLPDIPLLRKDFIFDPYQVYEARSAGASAVLLIVAGLEADRLRDLHALSLTLGLTPLVEVHTRRELDTALASAPKLIGVNNRDLRDFAVRLETTLALRPHIPPGIRVVAESGIHTPEDVARLGQVGVDAILVGEALVAAGDVAAKVRQLAGRL